MSLGTIHDKQVFYSIQHRLRAEYKAAGMTDEQIEAMYKFDLHQYNRDTAFYRHNEYLDDYLRSDCEDDDTEIPSLYYDNTLKFTEYEPAACKYNWLEDIENENLYKALLRLSDEDLKLLDLLAIKGLSRKEVCIRIGISEKLIYCRIKKLAGILHDFHRQSQ